MDDIRTKMMWRECERIGLAEAKILLKTSAGIFDREVITTWIEHEEHANRTKSEVKQLELTERSVGAAEVSATAAAKSADTSATSARAALFAAVVSFFAFVVSVAAYFKA